eukprot:m.132993 g.132993  ORF g.132993 m.132993 type:complete len:90 (-) comp17518_c0_seq2:848-1117(-)
MLYASIYTLCEKRISYIIRIIATKIMWGFHMFLQKRRAQRGENAVVPLLQLQLTFALGSRTSDQANCTHLQVTSCSLHCMLQCQNFAPL